MYDLSKRQECRNMQVWELMAMLQQMPKEAVVIFSGETHGFVHVEKDGSKICFDADDLEDDYHYDGQM